MKLLSIITLISVFTFGQMQLTSDPAQSKLTVAGTSSLHDWESVVNEFKVTGTLAETSINNLKVEATTRSIKSGKSVMDDKTWEALKAKQFTTITFAAQTVQRSGNQLSGNGTLTLAGKTKTVPVKASIVQESAQFIKVSGAVTLKMTDFGIEPPTAMFGTLQTGDEVTIKYEIQLNK